MFQLAPARDECNAGASVYGHAFTPVALAIALADASVKYVSAKMSPSTFMRALCPGDGQPLGEDWSE
jgi:hypothetical protein